MTALPDRGRSRADASSTASAGPSDAVSDLLARTRRWIADDPDPRTRDELGAVLDAAAAPDRTLSAEALADLADRFSGPLEFGTAGLRGEMGAGEHRMNRAVVIRAAAGLAAYARERAAALRPPAAPGTEPDDAPLVVIGYDARDDSEVFAYDSAAVFTGAGCRAVLLPGALPTPVLAYAVRALGADVGVMVTASHNPPQDNGYKVYLGGRLEPGSGRGAQIVPPADREIAAHIAAVGPARHVLTPSGGWTVLPAQVVEDYLTAALRVLDPAGPRALGIVLTPLHGVGGLPVHTALLRAGFTDTFLVPEQAEPDPAFPTVTFPNPEEAGALDHALEHARSRSADLVIANDPDADRCAVAFPDPRLPSPDLAPVWRMLRGDELGWLLADHLLRRREADADPDAGPDAPGGGGVVACSIVSSRMLARIAADHGVSHVETLTGFKWISRVPDLVFGYEEALGYCVAPELVRDKDGITAALLAAEVTAELAAAGRTIADALDDLAVRHGVHLTDQLSVRVSDIAEIATMMRRVRETPPEALGRSSVVGFDDLADPDPAKGLPPTDGVRLVTADDTRVIVRPSGTEPKLKCYFEALVGVSGGRAGLAAARAEAQLRLEAAREAMGAVLRA